MFWRDEFNNEQLAHEIFLNPSFTIPYPYKNFFQVNHKNRIELLLSNVQNNELFLPIVKNHQNEETTNDDQMIDEHVDEKDLVVSCIDEFKQVFFFPPEIASFCLF